MGLLSWIFGEGIYENYRPANTRSRSLSPEQESQRDDSDEGGYVEYEVGGTHGDGTLVYKIVKGKEVYVGRRDWCSSNP